MSYKRRLENLEKRIPERPVTIPLEERGLLIDSVHFLFPQLNAMSEVELSQWGPNTKQLVEQFLRRAGAVPGMWFTMSPDPEVPFEIVPNLGWRFINVNLPERPADD